MKAHITNYLCECNFVECYGIITALINNWNQFIMGEIIKLDRLCNKIVVNVKAENKSLTDFL
jgi:hypothetical protein